MYYGGKGKKLDFKFGEGWMYYWGKETKFQILERMCYWGKGKKSGQYGLLKALALARIA